MCTIYTFLLIIFFFHSCQSLFQNYPLDISTIKPRRNLTCLSYFGETDLLTNCEYCVFEYFTNGTDSVISYDCIYITNTYRLVTKRCSGFTDSSDIGYGLCSKLPFEYFDIDLLCICATDLCNENFTTCKQSVDLNPNLPALPSLIPLLTTETPFISCNDTPLSVLNSTYYCVQDSTPYINITECEEYVKTHTSLCVYLESDNENYLTVIAIPDEDHEYVLAEQIQVIQSMTMNTNFEQFYNETTGSFYIQRKETLENMNNYTMISNKCFCITNNCNTNLTACLQSYVEINIAKKVQYSFGMILFMKIIMTIHFYIYK